MQLTRPPHADPAPSGQIMGQPEVEEWRTLSRSASPVYVQAALMQAGMTSEPEHIRRPERGGMHEHFRRAAKAKTTPVQSGVSQNTDGFVMIRTPAGDQFRINLADKHSSVVRSCGATSAGESLAQTTCAGFQIMAYTSPERARHEKQCVSNHPGPGSQATDQSSDSTTPLDSPTTRLKQKSSTCISPETPPTSPKLRRSLSFSTSRRPSKLRQQWENSRMSKSMKW